jgi:hypothetical protein
VATERRHGERRQRNRRQTPGETVDVTRLEHENLCGQVDELLRAVRRIEQELLNQRQNIQTLEGELTIILSHLRPA